MSDSALPYAYAWNDPRTVPLVQALATEEGDVLVDECGVALAVVGSNPPRFYPPTGDVPMSSTFRYELGTEAHLPLAGPDGVLIEVFP